MGFFDIFKPLMGDGSGDSAQNIVNRLHGKLKEQLPNANDNQLVEMACMSGLLARIAYADMKIDVGEVESIENSLKNWTTFEDSEISTVAQLAVAEIQDLAGQENHLYTRPLNEIWDNDKKYKLLVALFAVAAGDGSVEVTETHEIKNICKGLLLEQKHFVSAQTTILDKLKSLQG